MIRKILLSFALLLLAAPLLVSAESTPTQITPTTNSAGINVNDLILGIPGTHDVKTEGLPGLVANFYDAALMLAGLLAFGSITYGGILYFGQPNNHEVQSQGKDRAFGAVFGLGLLICLYLLLHIINPDLTNLRFPTLQRLQPAQKVIDGAEPIASYGECKIDCSCNQHAAAHPGSNSCALSPALQAVVSCIRKTSPSVTLTTTDGKHAGNSCHFGGRDCKDGGHALDIGINGARAAGMSLPEAKLLVEGCNNTTLQYVQCRYESPNGSEIDLPANDPRVNHIHCNISATSCGCK